ncbi:DUF3971 domain-containing protein [Octadecabacter sp. 1_MG-2023]|uniref:DUF3971 domain-containing protein n=1 Tax=unclassified Octadecabacter TaxID=196158 RepID=UPI001C08496C|nr:MULTISPECIES: DUF3971 domain-containing protein [unclassified Octadecabacter]MBU2993493.1 DUF3971 domain-containing protein [Octadecabacter sp. B2R22]MDO6733051.1 DUF3971 domain-containing protein [Octadecabacter sp. 1_MG-2023]
MSESSPQSPPKETNGDVSADQAEEDTAVEETAVDDVDVDEAGPPERKPRCPKRRRRIWWSFRAVILVLIVAPFLMTAIAAALLIGHEVSAPSWIVREVERRAEEVLAGGELGFGAMKFTVGQDLHPQLVLENAVLRDADGVALARVPRIEGQISPRGALQGRVLAQEIRLTGAQISLNRANDGTVAFAFGQGNSALVAADGFLGLLDQIDQVFEEGALEALEQVHAEGLIINYVDARAGRSWVVDGGRISLDLSDDNLDLRADVALLSGRSYVTTAELTYASARDSRSAQIGVVIDSAAAEDIASQSPLLAWLGVLDAPISGAVRGELDTEGTLTGVSATLQIGAGEVRPTSQTRPVPFEGARTYLRYDPASDQMIFDSIEIDSDWGRIEGTARTYLREYTNGWPEALLGQVEITELNVAPEGVYDAPVELRDGSLDFRLRLDPFTLDIGQAVAMVGPTPLHLSGQVSARVDGWSVALDAFAEEIGVTQVMELWPEAVAPRTRTWLSENIKDGTARNANIAFRAYPNARPNVALTMDLSGGQVQFMRTLPPIDGARGTLSIIDRRVALTLEAGYVTAPEGGRLDLSGSSMVIPRTGIPNPPARFDLALNGRITAAMSILSQPPFNVLRDSDLPISFAQGRADVVASIDMPLGKDIAPEQRIWSATAQLSDVRSEVLIPGQVLTASALQLAVDPTSLIVRGPMRLGNVGATAVFSRALGAGSQGTARVEAEVTVGPAFFSAFNINLPDGMVSGESQAQLALNLSDPSAPTFRLTSGLQGTGLSLPAVGWSKARSSTGALTVAGLLGDQPRIDEFSISAPGLSTSGTIRLAAGGGLERAAFRNVRLGGWLDAPVVLIGRGQGRPLEVQIAGGTLDLRAANFGESGGEGGPMDIALDSLRVTDQIRIDDFRGSFVSTGGLQGEFSGNINGSAPVRGTLVPVGGSPAVRIVSSDAGSLFRATGLLRNAYNGDLVLTLIPTGAEGTYDGTLVGNDLRVRDAPALASLLDAISVVGLLTQLDGQGLLFNSVNAEFRLTPSQVILTQSSATGPGLGVSMDGIYQQVAGQMDFQGVISPFYLLNGIGSVLTRRGEGLIGFNFNLRGPVDNPQVIVNPLSALTPGMFREIFRRPPPTISQ